MVIHQSSTVCIGQMLVEVFFHFYYRSSPMDIISDWEYAFNNLPDNATLPFSKKDWQTLKAAVLEKQTTNSARAVICPSCANEHRIVQFHGKSWQCGLCGHEWGKLSHVS
jgi:ribosomal protein S27AE